MKVVVIIPTYNEAPYIEKLISRVLYLHPNFDILVVDDNSPDGTGRILDILVDKSERIKVLHRENKLGLGRAYVAGFKYILSSNNHYDRVIQMDADFSHDPNYLIDLIKATETKDISLGSRYISGGRITRWNSFRRMVSYIANIYARRLLNLKINDCTSGFRCFRREVLGQIKLDTIESNGYLFQIEVLSRCSRLGFSLQEVPIIFVEREYGKTKLSFYDIWEAFWGILKLSILKS